MDSEQKTSTEPTKRLLRQTAMGRLFWDKRFLNYTWIGILISLLNVFLLWLFIDILDIPTVVSSVVVIGATFIIRYLLYIFAKML
jgi:putative flippase GtrA